MPINPFTGKSQPYSGYAGIPSGEGSRFGEEQVIWAPSSGNEGVAITTGEKVAGVGVAGAMAYAGWTYGPSVLRKANSTLQSNQAANQLASNLGIKFRPNTGQTNVDFWYEFSRRVENANWDLRYGGKATQYFGDLFNLFSRAAHTSQALSFFVDRGPNPIFVDIGEKMLGPQGRQDALEYYSEIFNVKKSVLSTTDNLAFRAGEVFAANTVFNGDQKTLELGRKLASNFALVDSGRLALGYLVTMMPELGLRSKDTGSIRGMDMMGKSGYLLVKPKGGSFSVMGRTFNMPWGSKVAESWGAMALQRTSFLIDEMIGEAKKFGEFIDPEGKASFFRHGRKLGLLPEMAVGDMATMTARYTGLGLKVFGAWAAMNQFGYMMQHGGATERTLGGLGQSALLAGAGYKAVSMLGGNKNMGGIVGAALGLAGLAGVGPFENGIMAGVGEVAGDANRYRAMIGSVTGMNTWRRYLESIAPGSTSFSTAIGMGVATGIGGAALVKYLNKEKIVDPTDRRRFLRSLDWERPSELLTAPVRPEMQDVYDRIPNPIKTKIQAEIQGFVSSLEQSDAIAELSNVYGKASDTPAIRAGKLGDVLTARAYGQLREEIVQESGHWFSKTLKTIHRAPFIRAAAYASALATVSYAGLTGQLGSLDTVKEVDLKNQGKMLEPVRRGQKWEFGSTPYEGTDILYYRPTWIAQLRSGATQAGATGNRGALEEFILKNFSYKLEEENYWSRPAPITSAAFDQIPFIYPLIKPFADLIKRPKLMHVNEWARIGDGGEIEYLERSTGLESLPDPRLGAISMTAPTSPYSGSRVWSQSFHELTNLAGLVGFYTREGLNMVTGSSGLSDQRDQLESFSENVSVTSRFYDLHTGGGFMGIPFLSEPIRRFLVRDEVDNYNTIRNDLPDWMPVQLRYGNQYATLRYGEGGTRLPGEGYEARFNELRDTDPNSYPLLHRLNILGDVAPWSVEYRTTKARLHNYIKAGEASPEAASFFYNYTNIVETRMDKRSYNPYIYDQSQYDHITGTVSSVDPLTGTFTLEGSRGRYSAAGLSNEGSRIIAQMNVGYAEAAKVQRQNAEAFSSVLRPGMEVSLQTSNTLSNIGPMGDRQAAISSGGININRLLRKEGNFASDPSAIGTYALASDPGRMVGAGYQQVAHNLTKLFAPVEYLTTFGMSPMHKFLPERDVLEEYEQMHMYGEDIRLWQKPFSHWFGPALKTAAHNWLGMDFVSPGLQRNRETEEYFDKLKYYKYAMLAEEARTQGDIQSAKHYESVGRKTNIGSHGFYNEDRYKNLMGGTESRYALGFVREQSADRRAEILEAIPEFKRRGLEGQYAYQEMKALRQMSAFGGLSGEDEQRLRQLDQVKKDQGYRRSDENMEGYSRYANEGESFGSFMRRQEMANWAQNNKVPQPNWIGFNPSVDTEDVKLKYLEAEGLDYHDFSIYPSRANYIHRKSYITDEDVRQIGIYQGALGHAQNALIEANRMIQNPYSNVSYNIQNGSRATNYVDYQLRQHHSYIPSEF